MVQPAAGPVVPLRELRRHVEEVLAGLVAVQGDRSAPVGLAVVVRLVTGELLAPLVLQEERQDVLLAVPEVVGSRVGAPRGLPHVGVLVGQRGARAASRHGRRLGGVLDDRELLVIVGRRPGAGDEVGALLRLRRVAGSLAETGIILKGDEGQGTNLAQSEVTKFCEETPVK